MWVANNRDNVISRNVVFLDNAKTLECVSPRINIRLVVTRSRFAPRYNVEKEKERDKEEMDRRTDE